MTLIFLSVNTSLMFSNVYIPQKHLSVLVLLSHLSSDSVFFRTAVSPKKRCKQQLAKKKKKVLTVSYAS